MRVGITGDVLRPYDHGGNASKQNGNIRWFHSLTKRPIEEVTGNPVRVVTGAENDFDLWIAFSLMDMNCSVENWARLYGAKPNDAVLQYVAQLFGSFDFVVGFEVNHFLLRCLDRLGIPYIDVILHPVRFLDDVVLAFRSSSEQVRESLRSFALDEELIYVEAANLRGGLMKGSISFDETIRTAVFGQTSDDKVLVRDGAFLNLSEAQVAAKLRGTVGNSRVFFKPHPLSDTDFGIYRSGLRFHQIEKIKVNFYKMISSGTLDQVVSVASSVSIESKYFGVPGIHLAEYPFKFWPEQPEPDSYVPVAHEFFWAEFWRNVLLGDKTAPPRRGFFARNRLRFSLKSDWGYYEATTGM